MRSNSLISADELFYGFCKYYTSLRLTFEYSITTHTRRILRYFDEMGSMLGYDVLEDFSLGKLCNTPPSELSKKRIDMVWSRPDQFKRTGKHALSLESEQTSNREKIEGSVKKLVAVPASLSVLYCPISNKDWIIQLAQDELKRFRNIDISFMIIFEPWTSRQNFGKGSLETVLFDDAGKVRGKGIAEVYVEPKSGIRMFVNPKWE